MERWELTHELWREAAHWLLLSSPTQPLSPSHPPLLHSINCHIKQHSHLSLYTPLIQEEKGRRARKAKKAWFQAFGAERKDAYKQSV